MSRYAIRVEHLPSVTEHKISASEFRAKFREVFGYNAVSLDLEDNWYFYVNWDDWGKILWYAQRNLPKYVPDKFDCDNFARYVSVKVAELFGINTCGIAEGWTYLGKHKWNIFFDGDTFYQLESQQQNETFDFDDERYRPDEVLFG